MAKKKKGLDSIISAHAKEQCDGSAESFVNMMAHYGMKGCLFIITPDGEQLVYCFSSDESEKNTISILKACSETTGDYKNITLDKDS